MTRGNNLLRRTAGRVGAHTLWVGGQSFKGCVQVEERPNYNAVSDDDPDTLVFCTLWVDECEMKPFVQCGGYFTDCGVKYRITKTRPKLQGCLRFSVVEC